MRLSKKAHRLLQELQKILGVEYTHTTALSLLRDKDVFSFYNLQEFGVEARDILIANLLLIVEEQKGNIIQERDTK